MTLDIWINLANVIYLFSYSVRDILWLRVLTVVAATALIPYYYLQPEPLLAAIYWNIIFVAINLYWIVKLIIERKPVHLKPDEQQLYQLAFRNLTPLEVQSFFKLGIWRTVQAGETLVKCGEPVLELSTILYGRAKIGTNGRTITEIGAGQFVGEIATFLEKRVAPVDITTTEPTRMITWSNDALANVLKTDPKLAVAVQVALGTDMANLLTKSWGAEVK